MNNKKKKNGSFFRKQDREVEKNLLPPGQKMPVLEGEALEAYEDRERYKRLVRILETGQVKVPKPVMMKIMSTPGLTNPERYDLIYFMSMVVAVKDETGKFTRLTAPSPEMVPRLLTEDYPRILKLFMAIFEAKIKEYE